MGKSDRINLAESGELLLGASRHSQMHDAQKLLFPQLLRSRHVIHNHKQSKHLENADDDADVPQQTLTNRG